MIEVRSATPRDSASWRGMREALWPDGADGHQEEIERYFAGELSMPLEVLIAEGPGGDVLGFAELSIRPYAEGCYSGRVAFLEGWYVQSHARRRGVGRALVDAAERWAREQGCTEFGSDALIDNDISARAHAALGFDEVAQIRCFRKDLGSSADEESTR